MDVLIILILGAYILVKEVLDYKERKAKRQAKESKNETFDIVLLGNERYAPVKGEGECRYLEIKEFKAWKTNITDDHNSFVSKNAAIDYLERWKKLSQRPISVGLEKTQPITADTTKRKTHK